jgi:hypothetical protein
VGTAAKVGAVDLEVERRDRAEVILAMNVASIFVKDC